MNLMKLLASLFLAVSYVDGGGADGGSGGGDSGDSGDNGGNDGAGDDGTGDNGASDGGGDGDSGLLAGKYKDQSTLEAGYLELQTAFSSKDETHKGEIDAMKSPKEYNAGEGWGDDNAMNNRMMSVLQEVGKEHNITQGAYEAIFNGVTQMQERVAKDVLDDTMKSIPNFDVRSKNMEDLAMKYLRPDQATAMDEVMQTKESFEAVEVLLNKLKGGTLPDSTRQPSEVSDGELRKQISNLNPADTRERERLMKIVNSRGEGQGKLV